MFYLEHSEASLEKIVKCSSWLIIEKFSSEQLHTEKSKDEDKEAKQHQQSDDGGNRVDKWFDKITHSRPVSKLKIFNFGKAIFR